MDYTALLAQIQGAAQGGAFGKRVSGVVTRFTGNPAPASSSQLITQTVPQTVNPLANPGASVTDTSSPSSSFFHTSNIFTLKPLLIIAAVGGLVYLLVKKGK